MTPTPAQLARWRHTLADEAEALQSEMLHLAASDAAAAGLAWRLTALVREGVPRALTHEAVAALSDLLGVASSVWARTLAARPGVVH